MRSSRFANTALSDVLRRDHPWSWRAFALFLPSDWSFELWNALPDRVRTGRTASELAKGVPFFEYVNDVDPAAGQAFNGAMAAGSFLQALLFADAVDLAEVGSICDVGGGSGQLVAHLLRRHPHLRGAVLDLPALGTEAQRVFDGAGVADRAVFEGSDFFASVPAGYDVYTLFAVVHDWGDDDCVRILENVKQAMPGSGRVLVVEKPLPAKAVNDFSWFADMLMLVYADGGRERTNRQYEVLFARAGLRLVGRTRLPSLFEVFELRI
jgi:hypothetical protein